MSDYDDYPRDPANGRFLCTPEKPAPQNPKGLWSHTNVEDDGECSEGCCDDYRCRDCGARWRVEAAQ